MYHIIRLPESLLVQTETFSADSQARAIHINPVCYGHFFFRCPKTKFEIDEDFACLSSSGVRHHPCPHSFKSMAIFSFFTFVCLTLLHFSYLCNLRASLIAVDHERPVDSEQDVLDLKRSLYLPRGQGSLLDIFKESPLEVRAFVHFSFI